MSRPTPPSKFPDRLGAIGHVPDLAPSELARTDDGAPSDEHELALETPRAAVPSQPAPDFVDTAPLARRSPRERRLKLVLAFLSSALAAAVVTAGVIAWLSGGR